MISFPALHVDTQVVATLMVSKVTNGHVIVIGPFEQINRSRPPAYMRGSLSLRLYIRVYIVVGLALCTYYARQLCDDGD